MFLLLFDLLQTPEEGDLPSRSEFVPLRVSHRRLIAPSFPILNKANDGAGTSFLSLGWHFSSEEQCLFQIVVHGKPQNFPRTFALILGRQVAGEDENVFELLNQHRVLREARYNHEGHLPIRSWPEMSRQ